jgi:hypothetical protein
VSFNPPPGGDLDPPARVKWRVPARFKSLDQIKFVTTPSKSLCDWTLKKDVSLEERVNGGTGETEFFAWLDVSHFSVYALVQVRGNTWTAPPLFGITQSHYQRPPKSITPKQKSTSRWNSKTRIQLQV